MKKNTSSTNLPVKTNEFDGITKYVINYLWDEGFITIPFPDRGLKEFRLDMPAFKKFDALAMKWEDDWLKVIAVESKDDPSRAISQARTYQMCIPEVYIASRKTDIPYQQFDKYGIGYISVGRDVRKQLEPRKSILFNSSFYQSEVVPQAVTILAFYDFLTKVLGRTREEIRKSVDYVIQTERLWISDRPATQGIQWSTVYDKESILFGINIESKKAAKKAFSDKTEQDLRDLCTSIRKLPYSSTIDFYRRSPPGIRKMPGSESYKYPEFGDSKHAVELTSNDVEFIVDNARKDDMVGFAIWIEICKTDEIHVLSRDDLWRKMNEYKTDYLDFYYDKLE